jgi:hypothetical protein
MVDRDGPRSRAGSGGDLGQFNCRACDQRHYCDYGWFLVALLAMMESLALGFAAL